MHYLSPIIKFTRVAGGRKAKGSSKTLYFALYDLISVLKCLLPTTAERKKREGFQSNYSLKTTICKRKNFQSNSLFHHISHTIIKYRCRKRCKAIREHTIARNRFLTAFYFRSSCILPIVHRGGHTRGVQFICESPLKRAQMRKCCCIE